MPGARAEPEELTAANVVSSWIESVAIFLAPAAAGVLLGVERAGDRLRGDGGRRRGGRAAHARASRPGRRRRRRLRWRRPSPASASSRATGPRALLVGLLGAQYIVIGALDVLYVVLALGVLDLGESGAGYLNAAFGLGGVLGHRRDGRARRAARGSLLRCSPALAVWTLALWATRAPGRRRSARSCCSAAAGAGRSLLDVAGRTLLQRTAPTELLSRVFGVLEGLTMAGLALGSILVPVLVALGGARAALVGVGAVLPLIALLAGRSLLAVDRSATVPVTEIALLRSSPTFACSARPSSSGSRAG